MIVQCDECKAKFKLDDSKVKAGGVKVRCSKCKHIFVVQPEAGSEEPDFDSLLSGLDSSAPASQGGTPDTTESAAGPGGEAPSSSFAGEDGEFSFDERGAEEAPASMLSEQR
ncbi:MAG TPA: zinc-ribbon domain-containing protein, partial [Geobacteraceae bacterium]